MEGWSRVHARIFPREETAVDRRSGNALDMESDGFPLRNKKRNFDRGQIPVFKIPLPLQLINSVEKKTFERGRIGPVSKVFTTATAILFRDISKR